MNLSNADLANSEAKPTNPVIDVRGGGGMVSDDKPRLSWKDYVALFIASLQTVLLPLLVLVIVLIVLMLLFSARLR